MNILAIDTSTKYLSAAVAVAASDSRGVKILSSTNVRMEKTLSTSIVPRLEALFKKTVGSVSKIDGFVVGLGPGSFTSLRVGLSTVKAFALALDRPVVGIPSLDAAAMGTKVKEGRVGVLSDARRGLVYACFYERNNTKLKRLTEYQLVPLEHLVSEIKKTSVLTGDALEVHRDAIKKILSPKHPVKLEPEKSWRPDARWLIPLAQERFFSGKIDNPDSLVPMYLYPEDCQVSPRK